MPLMPLILASLDESLDKEGSAYIISSIEQVVLPDMSEEEQKAGRDAGNFITSALTRRSSDSGPIQRAAGG